MDTPSTIIGLVPLAIFVLPILYLIVQQNNKQKQGLKNLKNIGNKNNLRLEKTEVSSNLLLGLDSEAHKLLVVEPVNNMQHRVVDLRKVSRSTVNAVAFPNNQKLIKRVSLDLLNSTGKMDIVFYDDDDDNDNHNAAERLAVAKKWNQLIRPKLSA
ncbi:hypothetical protein SAMN05444483_10271 [Salegentibacter echinorum]|uniref:Uncharacterized protein n=1 Tax=Salegentibacter echinorum TaxID=1073325 RepID=A0A1M5DR16_SALEC|nr:hypothetical protein [Salegentibacter echinorum]SHF69301.1 hypothetical protein SAMN05444483_10271 [Salegentibacter echinorum]